MKDLLKPEAPSLTEKERELVDEFARLDAHIRKRLGPAVSRHEALRKKLSEIANRFPRDRIAVLRGHTREAEFSPGKRQRTITDMQGVINYLKKLLGYDGLLPLLRVKLEDVDEHIPAAAQERLVAEDPHGGPRTLVSTGKVSP